MRRRVNASRRKKEEGTQLVHPVIHLDTIHTAIPPNGPALPLEARKSCTNTARALVVHTSLNMTLHLPQSLIVHRIHPNRAASQTSVFSSEPSEQTGIEEGSHPRLRPYYPICHLQSLPFQLPHHHLTLSMLLPLPPLLLCLLPLWFHPLQEHPSPPPWPRQVPNYSTRDCALYLSPRGFLSPLTYPSKPRAFAHEGVQPIFPAWKVRSDVQCYMKKS